MSTRKGFFAIAILLLGASAQGRERPSLDEAKLVGKWRSVKMEGKDIAAVIVGIYATFDKRDNFTMTVKVRQGRKNRSSTSKGTYKVNSDILEMKIGERTQRSQAWFEKGLLVLSDQHSDSRIHFRRVRFSIGN